MKVIPDIKINKSISYNLFIFFYDTEIISELIKFNIINQNTDLLTYDFVNIIFLFCFVFIQIKTKILNAF